MILCPIEFALVGKHGVCSKKVTGIIYFLIILIKIFISHSNDPYLFADDFVCNNVSMEREGKN